MRLDDTYNLCIETCVGENGVSVIVISQRHDVEVLGEWCLSGRALRAKMEAELGGSVAGSLAA